jgi:hypothetical protein
MRFIGHPTKLSFRLKPEERSAGMTGLVDMPYADSANSSRPISQRLISDVPAPIS